MGFGSRSISAPGALKSPCVGNRDGLWRGMRVGGRSLPSPLPDSPCIVDRAGRWRGMGVGSQDLGRCPVSAGPVPGFVGPMLASRVVPLWQMGEIKGCRLEADTALRRCGLYDLLWVFLRGPRVQHQPQAREMSLYGATSSWEWKRGLGTNLPMGARSGTEVKRG